MLYSNTAGLCPIRAPANEGTNTVTRLGGIDHSPLTRPCRRRRLHQQESPYRYQEEEAKTQVMTPLVVLDDATTNRRRWSSRKKTQHDATANSMD